MGMLEWVFGGWMSFITKPAHWAQIREETLDLAISLATPLCHYLLPYTGLVSRVCWHMGLKICVVWRGWSGWWWDGCAECRWRIENAVWICSFLGVQSSADVVRHGRLRWFGALGIWSVRVWMIGCRSVERWRWQGWDVGGGIGRLDDCVWRMI